MFLGPIKMVFLAHKAHKKHPKLGFGGIMNISYLRVPFFIGSVLNKASPVLKIWIFVGAFMGFMGVKPHFLWVPKP